MRFIFITIDGTHGAALREAAALLQRDHGVDLAVSLYTATSLRSAADWQRLEDDVAGANFVFGARLFGEELVRPLERLLLAATCPVCMITSNPALINCTRLGKFVLCKSDEPQEPGLLMQLAQKFRPRGGSGEGKRQLAIMRNLSKVLKFIPGKARDLHTYISAHQYWADSSPENLRRLLALLVDRYVPGFEGRLKAQEPLAYPPAALFHPDAPAPFPDLKSYEEWRRQRAKEARRQGDKKGSLSSFSTPNSQFPCGSVGLLALRSTALTGNTAHLDALVRALEARGIEVRLAYGSGLDMRPAIEQFFTTSAATQPSALGARRSALSTQSSALSPQSSSVDLLINGTGFSLVGGPAESRPDDARVALEALDVGFLDMIPLSFQRVEEWRADDTGLAPIQLALNVALPELDGAAEPLVIGGPTAGSETFVALPDQIDVAARRVARRVALRRKANRDKKIAVVLFNFPPTLGNVGTAAYLDVFASLHRLLLALRDDGYDVEVPASVDELRGAVVEGNALLHGTDGNVAAHLPMADYTRLFPHYREIEPFWGRAPGELLNDGKRFQILGLQLGNVFVGIQPSFGYERDPMRLLMAKDAAPNHGFAAFYTWLEHVFGADAVVHFGTHGALEFMPGKQAGLSADCWPTRLIGGLPNLYYYSVNNPSEATIAKRRGAATTVSYLVPPLQQAGLYKGLRLLKDSIDSYRKSPSADLLEDIHTQAAQLSITPDDDEHASGEAYVAALAHELLLIEQRMIPLGLHVLGKPPAPAELVDFLALASAFSQPDPQLKPLPQLVAASLGYDYERLRAQLKHDRAAQERWEQVDAIVREAMRLFVEGASDEAQASRSQPTHSSQRDSQHSVDAYLARAAGIRPGTLTKLWAAFARLLGNIVASREIEGLLHGLRGGFIPPSPSNDVVRNHDVVPTGRNVHGLDPYRAPSAAAQAAGERLMG
ncbi:MAG: magnesium chelatase subunit H, partial [Chloroflexales bacterium]|nr:magnesium chelatase subunit H [Chloroflexales bacterium]